MKKYVNKEYLCMTFQFLLFLIISCSTESLLTLKFIITQRLFGHCHVSAAYLKNFKEDR